MNADVSERDDLFWRLAEALLADPTVTHGTMMGFPCLRANGNFLACARSHPAAGSSGNGSRSRFRTKSNGQPCSTKPRRS